RALRDAWSEWREIGAPYEVARTRTLIALAHGALGDDDTARIELEAAAEIFERLGALPDAVRARQLVSGVGKRPEHDSLTLREQQVLRLVATGKTNRAIAAALEISEKTVARHVSNIFLKLHLSSRAGATAYAYEHGLLQRPA
ncbi:MAG: response regulator transcription factor, partial [Gemmatimonadales bacterium]